jgi:hypothetical protein
MNIQRVHLVWIACALILWLALGMPALEAFQLSGWLSEYGEFDWLELPAWLKMNETAPPANASLITMSFSRASPRLVALENKKERLVRKTTTTLDVEAPAAKNLVETRNEVWAVTRSASTNRYIIRSASERGEYVAADTEGGAVATCKRLVLRDAIYDDWIIEPAPGTNTFFIRTTMCRDGERYYLATNASGKLVMLSGTAIKANDKVAAWEFKAVLGPASTTGTTPRPATPVATPVATKDALTTRPPVITTPAPPAKTTRPPRVTTRPPRVTTRPPRVTTRPPRVTTRPPRVTTRPPRVTTRPPRVTTRPPARR